MLKVKYGPNIEIVVRRATVRSDLNRQRIVRRLLEGVPDNEHGEWALFAGLCSATQRSKGLSFDPVALVNADKDTLDAAYNCFMDMDKALKDRWFEAMQQADAPIDDVIGPEPLPENADPNA